MNLSSARHIVRVFVVASLVAFVPRVTHGQRLVPGDTLRITSAHSRVGGLLLSHDSATLVILRADGWDTLRFLRTDITRAEVLRGRHRAGVRTIGKGALIGLGIGSVLAVVALQGYTRENTDARELKGIAATVCMVVGTGAGTVIGTVASFRRVDHWVPFDPRSPSEASLQR